MPTFAEACAWTPDGDGAFTGTVDPSWMQGRTSFGGLAAAIGLQAARSVEPEGRTPRAVHTAFFGPLGPEPARVGARVIRRGRSMTHARAEIVQGDELRTQVTVTYADDRPSGITVTPAAPMEHPGAETLSDLPYIEGVTPAFTRHFAMRWGFGAMPFSGATDPRIGGWCRHRSEPGQDPCVALLALCDVFPSPLIPMMRRPAPASSVTWTTHFVDVPERFDPRAWWWYQSEIIAAEHGHATLRAALHHADGRLAATIEQLVAVFDRP